MSLSPYVADIIDAVIDASNGAGHHCSHRSGSCHSEYYILLDDVILRCHQIQALIRDGPELWHMITHSSEDGRNERG
jgi:hypothetical protein